MAHLRPNRPRFRPIASWARRGQTTTGPTSSRPCSSCDPGDVEGTVRRIESHLPDQKSRVHRRLIEAKRTAGAIFEQEELGRPPHRIKKENGTLGLGVGLRRHVLCGKLRAVRLANGVDAGLDPTGQHLVPGIEMHR